MSFLRRRQTPWGLATWLASLDNPESRWRKTVTLEQIIEEAKRAVEHGETIRAEAVREERERLREEGEDLANRAARVVCEPRRLVDDEGREAHELGQAIARFRLRLRGALDSDREGESDV